MVREFFYEVLVASFLGVGCQSWTRKVAGELQPIENNFGKGGRRLVVMLVWQRYRQRSWQDHVRRNDAAA